MRKAQGKAVGGAILMALIFTPLMGRAQSEKAREAAHIAFDAEMAHEGNDCPDQMTLVDRNECLNNVRVETYKNFDAFFAGLREALIDESPNDDNALALDATERSWEKYRTQMCDTVSNVYDVGTIKHPGSTRPNARVTCQIHLTRGRMRDLMRLYEPTLS
jgi:uncharacterized protein YecT (DUF1311 family)